MLNNPVWGPDTIVFWAYLIMVVLCTWGFLQNHIGEKGNKYPLELRTIWFIMMFWPSRRLSHRAHEIYNNLSRDGKEDE